MARHFSRCHERYLPYAADSSVCCVWAVPGRFRNDLECASIASHMISLKRAVDVIINRPTASSRGEGVKVKQEPNWDSDPEDKQLQGLKERNEFAAWLHDRDKQKTHNIGGAL
ncbi:hypothetical protein HPB50_028742 [Hyalomma asiaticum]|nr:hypothetical protein HPB50_028742 [Hyalomma asiaticum]